MEQPGAGRTKERQWVFRWHPPESEPLPILRAGRTVSTLGGSGGRLCWSILSAFVECSQPTRKAQEWVTMNRCEHVFRSARQGQLYIGVSGSGITDSSGLLIPRKQKRRPRTLRSRYSRSQTREQGFAFGVENPRCADGSEDLGNGRSSFWAIFKCRRGVKKWTNNQMSSVFGRMWPTGSELYSAGAQLRCYRPALKDRTRSKWPLKLGKPDNMI